MTWRSPRTPELRSVKPGLGECTAEKQAYYQWLADQVTNLLRKEPGSRNRFAMIVFSEGGKPQFVGRGNRIDAIRALREMANRLERREVEEVASSFPVAEPSDPSTIITASIPVPLLQLPNDAAEWCT